MQQRTLATLISRKNSRPKPKYKGPKREWRQPRWKPQPRKINQVQMWIPKRVVQTMRTLDYQSINVVKVHHANAQKIVNSFDPNEEKVKGPIYR